MDFYIICTVIIVALVHENCLAFQEALYKAQKSNSEHLDNELGIKSHHTKENHQKTHLEQGANDRIHHHTDGIQATNQKQSTTNHGYQYGDQGRYAKGHDTKGHHNIKKLNEYEKQQIIFDENHDQSHKIKHGQFNIADQFKNGQYNDNGHIQKGFYNENRGANGMNEEIKSDIEEKQREHTEKQRGFLKEAEEFSKKTLKELEKFKINNMHSLR